MNVQRETVAQTIAALIPIRFHDHLECLVWKWEEYFKTMGILTEEEKREEWDGLMRVRLESKDISLMPPEV